jgi:hypothetical protein
VKIFLLDEQLTEITFIDPNDFKRIYDKFSGLLMGFGEKSLYYAVEMQANNNKAYHQHASAG